MENISKLLLAIVLVLFTGCQTESVPEVKEGNELTFSSTVRERNGSETRALDDDFFTDGNTISVTIETSDAPGTQQQLTYVYESDRIFRSNPGFRFKLDDTYIQSLSARWPGGDVRSNGLITNQSKLEDYKSADWLSGGVSSQVGGIMPTDAPVPLVFQRENVLLDFELVGQNTTGLDIESLLIELQSGGDEGPQAFWAYCGNPNGHAELIMPPNSQILSPNNYLIGRIRVTGQPNDYTIIFPETDLTLEAGHRYLITLTPQGYFMNAYVFITGFTDADGGIGIPFAQPTPDANGNFTISNAQQLIGMSYLIRNYDDGRSFVWSQRTYIIADGLALTSEQAAQYVPIPAESFTGSIQDTAGQSVTQLTNTDGSILQLFN